MINIEYCPVCSKEVTIITNQSIICNNGCYWNNISPTGNNHFMLTINNLTLFNFAHEATYSINTKCFVGSIDPFEFSNDGVSKAVDFLQRVAKLKAFE
jgi:hypothetical protein